MPSSESVDIDKYDEDLRAMLLHNNNTNNNPAPEIPVRKRTSSYHSSGDSSVVISLDDLAARTTATTTSSSSGNVQDGGVHMVGSTQVSRRTHRRSNSRGSFDASIYSSRNAKPRHSRYNSWGGNVSPGGRKWSFDPNDPLAPPIARKKGSGNGNSNPSLSPSKNPQEFLNTISLSSSLPNEIVSNHESNHFESNSYLSSDKKQQDGYAPIPFTYNMPIESASNADIVDTNLTNERLAQDEYSKDKNSAGVHRVIASGEGGIKSGDISPLSPPSLHSVININTDRKSLDQSSLEMENFLAQAANDEDDDLIIVQNDTDSPKARNDTYLPGSFLSERRRFANVISSGSRSSLNYYDSDETSSSVEPELLLPPGSSNRRAQSKHKNIAKSQPIFGNRARISSSGTISSVEDLNRELRGSSSSIPAISTSAIGVAQPYYQDSNVRPSSLQSNQMYVQEKDQMQQQSIQVNDDSLYIDGFDFDKNSRQSLDSSCHHGSEFMTYSVKSFSYGEEDEALEEGSRMMDSFLKNDQYGSISPHYNTDMMKSFNEIGRKDYPKNQNDNNMTSKNTIGPHQSKIDSIFSSVRSVSTAEIEKDMNDSELYMKSDFISRAIPNRLVALLVTLIAEIPVLLMINDGSTRINDLIGQRRYQLLMAFLPLSCAISGNCSLQGSSLTTRAISHRHVTKEIHVQWMIAEGKVASFLGLVLGIVMGLLAYIWSGMDFAFGMAIGIAQFFSVLSAGLTGTVAPLISCFIFHRDSGKWSGLLETVIQDLIGSFAMVILSFHVITWFGAEEF